MNETALALLAAPIASVLTYSFTRGKQKADTQLSIATGATQAVEAISSVLDSLREELDQTKRELIVVTGQLHDMRIQNERLIKENKHLMQKVEELKVLVEKLNN
jgi:hypothetical protein